MDAVRFCILGLHTKFFLIHLFSLKGRVERVRVRASAPATGSPECPQQPGLDQTEARRREHHWGLPTPGPSRCLLPAGCASTGMWHQRQRRDCDSGPVRGCAHSRSRLLSRKPATEIRFGDSAGREVLRAQVPQIHEVPGSAKPAQTLLQQLPCAGHGPECSPVSAPESCTDPRTRSSPHPSHRWGD